MTFSNVHFIVNPSSGGSRVPFDLIGQYMAQADYKTTLHVTKITHGAKQCATEALAAGADLIVAYGGDGTIMEVANYLHQYKLPMAIIPGGTANVIAHELNIPVDTRQALELIFNKEHELRSIDAGRIGNEHFLLRMSLGWEAELSQRPTIEDKTSWGTLAYTRAALEALGDLEPVTYELTLDDDTVETVTGINCSICNIGNVGLYGISIGSGIIPDDGLLSVLILQSKNIQAIIDITQNLLANTLPLEIEERLIHYKAKKVSVVPSQPQRMSNDGEAFVSDFPIIAECVSDFISILTPKVI